jgi:hypothetical protein
LNVPAACSAGELDSQVKHVERKALNVRTIETCFNDFSFSFSILIRMSQLPTNPPGTPTSPSPRSHQITLSAIGLEQTSVLDPDSFLFVVGDSEYRCSRFQAVFFSKTVSDLFLTDPLTTEFVIDDIPDPDRHFGSIMNLAQHGTVEVTEMTVPTLQKFVQRLKCDELSRLLFEFELSGEELNERNAVSRLVVKSKRLLSIDEEIEFIASRFDQIEGLDSLPLSLLEIILESFSLRIESEDWLLDFICGLESDFENLIRYVRCEFLSGTGIAKFIDSVSVDRIDSVLWGSVCRRLVNTCSSPPDAQRFNVKCTTFSHGNSDFEGILHHLSSKCGGNVHTKGLVAITASTTHFGYPEPVTIADFAKPSTWISHNSANSSVMFDFKELLVSIDGYSVKSGAHSHWLQAWEIEVSNDGNSWKTRDKRSTQELKGSNVTKYFECASPSSAFHRFVRLRQTGINGAGCHNLEIANLEFFGRLRRAESAQ